MPSRAWQPQSNAIKKKIFHSFAGVNISWIRILELLIKKKKLWLPEVDNAVYFCQCECYREGSDDESTHLCKKTIKKAWSGSASGPGILAGKWKTPDSFVLHILQC